DIDYLGKTITVRSQSGNPETCIIDCEGSLADPHRGFYFHHGEGTTSVLEGITITQGYMDWHDHGGGIRCQGASPAITNCRVIGNVAPYGGGVRCDDYASPAIVGCLISGNEAHGGIGGGLSCSSGCNPTLTDCAFVGNIAVDGVGGGVRCNAHIPAQFTNCTFVNNQARRGGGLAAENEEPSPTLHNCTFYGNSAIYGSGVFADFRHSLVLENTIIVFGVEGPAILCDDMASAALTCCNVYGNEGGDWVGGIAGQDGVYGNISEHPLFCDPAGGDYALQANSPCAPLSPPNEECDLIGAWPVSCDPLDYACCVGNNCQILSQKDCATAGGQWFAGLESCDPNPCQMYACCVAGTCELRNQTSCVAAGGEWIEGLESCEPNPCEYQICLVLPDGTGDYPTIQAAINAAGDGWIVELGDGIFAGEGNRDVEFDGKTLTVRSQSGDPHACIIDCGGSGTVAHRGFLFDSGEGPGAVVSGVTIRSGYALVGSNWFDRYGGGVLCIGGASPTFNNCIFRENYAGGGGGGINCSYSRPTLVACVFDSNRARLGGGMTCSYNGSPTLTNCTFSDNSAWMGAGGIYCFTTSAPILENTIIAFGTQGEAVGGDGSPTLVCCNVFGNAGGNWVGCIASQYGVNGNISEDPLFCGEQNPEQPYTLHSASPCLPGANPECGLIGACPIGCPAAGAPDRAKPPRALELRPPQPNPSNAATLIVYGIPSELGDLRVVLDVYDPTGRLVGSLVDEPRPAGFHRATWAGTDRAGGRAASGVYFMRLSVGDSELTRRVILLQ
ncbi:MAG: right-handed parallel beta-helix repeat-containing protein, partial [Candidatus Eisenbacteria sp.]|nr:right-handed parallel beta-helix repeat-containing protein [Candidatus Eisenbacteria bacterium]